MLLLRLQQWSFASIGALITVTALLMEPFLQLIPAYRDGQAEIGPSSLPRSTYYKDYFAYYGPNGGFSESEYCLSHGSHSCNNDDAHQEQC